MSCEANHSGFNLPDDPVVNFWARSAILDSECAKLRDKGCVLFRQGYVEEACASFDQAGHSCPDCIPYLWQRGIAMYCVGEFQKASGQFALGQSVNPNDTEEVIWEMLSSRATAGANPESLEAHLTMSSEKLKSVVEPRPVMRAVQLLFLGMLPCSELITALQETKKDDKGMPALHALFDQYLGAHKVLTAPSSQDVFYLWLYAALFEQMKGRPAASFDALTASLRAGYEGDDYMLYVARVLLQRMPVEIERATESIEVVCGLGTTHSGSLPS